MFRGIPEFKLLIHELRLILSYYQVYYHDIMMVTERKLIASSSHWNDENARLPIINSFEVVASASDMPLQTPFIDSYTK